MNADKKIVQKQVESNIRSRVGDDAFAAYGEIIAALSYACTFKSPRRFADMDMDGCKWQDLATTITAQELQTVNACLNCRANNRLFFILGCLTRVYSRRKSAISKSDYPQRRYTKAELESVITKIDDLKYIEW